MKTEIALTDLLDLVTMSFCDRDPMTAVSLTVNRRCGQFNLVPHAVCYKG